MSPPKHFSWRQATKVSLWDFCPARAGVAKGTLYLYFGTKEEVLLSLYSQEFERFCSELTAGIPAQMTDAEFVSRIYDTSVADPLFLALHARLGTVIEQNISVDALITSKRNMATHFQTMVNQLSGPLDLDYEQTLAALTGISALLTGSYDGGLHRLSRLKRFQRM